MKALAPPASLRSAPCFYLSSPACGGGGPKPRSGAGSEGGRPAALLRKKVLGHPLSPKTSFLHPQDVLFRSHTCTAARHFGGRQGTPAAPQTGPGGRGGQFFSEQLYCGSPKGEGRSQARKPQCPQARALFGGMAGLRRRHPAGLPKDRGFRRAVLRHDPVGHRSRPAHGFVAGGPALTGRLGIAQAAAPACRTAESACR